MYNYNSEHDQSVVNKFLQGSAETVEGILIIHILVANLLLYTYAKNYKRIQSGTVLLKHTVAAVTALVTLDIRQLKRNAVTTV